MEILLIHPGALGDIILSLPAVALLRSKYPAARITLAANLDHVAPVRGACVDAAISLSSLPLHNLYSNEELPPEDRRFWRSFDKIISWTGAADPGFARKLKSVHPHARVQSWKPGVREQRHVSQLFIDSLGDEVTPGAIPQPVRITSDSAGLGVCWLSDHGWNGIDRLVTLHPGAGSEAKRWPLERFVELAGYLKRRKHRVLVVEGPAEPGLAGRFNDAIAASCLPLDMLASVIANSGLFIGNDSGIAHLAAALGIPCAVLFGPTMPQHWSPLGAHVKVLWDPQGSVRCENITVEDVIRGIAPM